MSRQYTKWDGKTPLFTPDGKYHSAEELLELFPVFKSPNAICEIIGDMLTAVDNVSILLSSYGIPTTGDAALDLETLNAKLAEPTPEPEPTVEEKQIAMQEFQLMMNLNDLNEPDALERIAAALEFQNIMNL